LAVSRKSARRAVDRNRVKRVMRESFRHHQDFLGGRDILVIAQGPVHALKTLELQKELALLWRKLAR